MGLSNNWEYIDWKLIVVDAGVWIVHNDVNWINSHFPLFLVCIPSPGGHLQIINHTVLMSKTTCDRVPLVCGHARRPSIHKGYPLLRLFLAEDKATCF